jgi:hypothetical protein
MKREVQNILKEKGKLSLFTEQRYSTVTEVMKHGMKKDLWLKNYLSLDPLNKAEWTADHIIKFAEAGQI